MQVQAVVTPLIACSTFFRRVQHPKREAREDIIVAAAAELLPPFSLKSQILLFFRLSGELSGERSCILIWTFPQAGIVRPHEDPVRVGEVGFEQRAHGLGHLP